MLREVFFCQENEKGLRVDNYYMVIYNRINIYNQRKIEELFHVVFIGRLIMLNINVAYIGRFKIIRKIFAFSIKKHKHKPREAISPYYICINK